MVLQAEMKGDRFALYKDEFVVLTHPKVERAITIYGDDIEKAIIDISYIVRLTVRIILF